MKLGHDMLFLSNADIAGVGVRPEVLAQSIDEMLRAKAAGDAVTKPKLGIYPKPGTFFQAMAGVLADPPYAAVKWTGVVHDNDKRSLPHVSPLILLNDRATGLPLALLDGKWITTHRTAALTAVGAKYLARKDSESMGFIACGVQARSHLAAFRASFPVKRVVAYSRRRATADAFAAATALRPRWSRIPAARSKDSTSSSRACRNRPASSRSSTPPGCRPAPMPASSMWGGAGRWAISRCSTSWRRTTTSRAPRW
jgi:ornithine cyclodeaminase/alanine dehydrogenase